MFKFCLNSTAYKVNFDVKILRNLCDIEEFIFSLYMTVLMQ